MVNKARLVIEPLGLKHVGPFQRAIADPEICRCAGLPWPFPALGGQIWIEQSLHRREHGKELAFAVLHSQASFVGVCKLSLKRAEATEANISYWIDRLFWGQGIATLTVRNVLAVGFNDLKLTSVRALVYSDNTASIRVLEKTGFGRRPTLPPETPVETIHFEILCNDARTSSPPHR